MLIPLAISLMSWIIDMALSVYRKRVEERWRGRRPPPLGRERVTRICDQPLPQGGGGSPRPGSLAGCAVSLLPYLKQDAQSCEPMLALKRATGFHHDGALRRGQHAHLRESGGGLAASGQAGRKGQRSAIPNGL